MSLKSTACWVALALLFGALSTVGVSWAIVRRTSHVDEWSDRGAVVLPSGERVPFLVWRQAHRELIKWHLWMDRGESSETPLADPPVWSAVAKRHTFDEGLYGFVVNVRIEEACGWPLLSMRSCYVAPPVPGSDGAASDFFGQSVAIDGDTLVVGASGGDAAYVFERSGASWTEIAILVGNDTEVGDEFGFTVDIDGDLAIVGAWKDDSDNVNPALDNAGSAYVFTRDAGGSDAWDQTAFLSAPDQEANDQFGSVAITGTRAVIGATYEDPGGTDQAGSAYVFEDVDN